MGHARSRSVALPFSKVEAAMVFSRKTVPFIALIFTFYFSVLAISVLADGPVPDTQCRLCHGDSTHTLTFSSGEEISLQVPLDVFDRSPHGVNSENPLNCTDCHRTVQHYLFPHQKNTAQSHREFTTQIADNCTRCHFPHKPFHPEGIAAAEELPVCTDCHGDHNITAADEIPQSMPAACVACHTDQPESWAVALIPAREGVGEHPAANYIGSDRCAGCHEETYGSWQHTLHANFIQDATADPSVILGDFNRIDPDLTFTTADVQYTIGSKWKQRYITKTDDGNFYILPAQWNFETQEWVPYHTDDWQTREWRQTCGSCHVTGLNTETWDFVEFGVGCESCHGPGAEHAADPYNVQLYKKVDDQVCGSCHSRGTSPDGYNFPATYRPGDTLTSHFTFTTDAADLWPDGSARKHHQQYMDWQLGSKMQQSGMVNCVTCHSVHDTGQAEAQLNLPLNELCLQCHSDKKRLLQHMPYHEQASKKHEFLCSDCHLPKMATSAVPYDIHNHSFLQPNPDETVAHGGLTEMLNSCNICHTDRAETPEWAAETIAYVAASQPKAFTSFNPPGIKITPPPPPTPIPSAGQKADAEEYKYETGRWIRVTFFILLGLIVLGIVVAAVRTINKKRTGNV